VDESGGKSRVFAWGGGGGRGRGEAGHRRCNHGGVGLNRHGTAHSLSQITLCEVKILEEEGNEATNSILYGARGREPTPAGHAVKRAACWHVYLLTYLLTCGLTAIGLPM
jgi:hypothetical protein